VRGKPVTDADLRGMRFDPAVLGRMDAAAGGVAGVIARALQERRPVLVRYNNDADGICGGLAVYRAALGVARALGIEPREVLREYQNNGAIYTEEYAGGDVLLLRGVSDEKPLVVLVDFGANPESIPGLKLARGEGCSIAIIDHHPYSEQAVQLAEAFVSPWAVAGGTSDYTAGFVAGEVAKKLLPGIDVRELQGIALAGDRSKLFKASRELLDKALALDYLADTAYPRNTLAKCEALLADSKKLAESYGEANGKLSDAVRQAKATLKVRPLANGIVYATLDTSKLERTGPFPPNGKVVSFVHDDVAANESRPVVTIGRGRSDALSFRANTAARTAGFNASRFIEEMKKALPNAIESGGGHDVAASMRVRRGLVKFVLGEVEKKLEGEQLKR